jgi:hypothetical protein
MAINLQDKDAWTHYLVARLCEEAGVCLHDEETNKVEIHAATYDCIFGLMVQDEHGQKFRLKVRAERITQTEEKLKKAIAKADARFPRKPNEVRAALLEGHWVYVYRLPMRGLLPAKEQDVVARYSSKTL